LAETLQSLDEQTEKQLQDTLNKLQATKWKPVENWPQTFWKRNQQGRIVMLTVYVDDFVLSGPNHMVEWKAIRKVVTTTEPTPVGRVLGVHRKFSQKPNGVREVIMDMQAYTNQALDMCESVSGARL